MTVRIVKCKESMIQKSEFTSKGLFYFINYQKF